MCRRRVADLGIDLLGDVLTAPSFRDADVESERHVILDELAMDDDSPEDVAHRVFAEQVFGGHPLGRETAGERDSVNSITTDDVRAFFAEHYRAGNTVVAVAGAVDADAVIARWSPRRSRRCPRATVGWDAPPPPATPARRSTSTTTPSRCTSSWAAARSPATDPDREALDVVNHVLGGGLSSRLFEEIREKRGLVYSVFSGLACYSDTGAWSISTSAQPRHADEVVRLVNAELTRLVADGITDDELEIAKGYLTGSYELGLEDTGSRMARNGGLLCTRGSILPVTDQVQRWLAVDQAAVRRVIDRVFSAEPIVVTVGPA